jgi:hypothetical protein
VKETDASPSRHAWSGPRQVEGQPEADRPMLYQARWIREGSERESFALIRVIRGQNFRRVRGRSQVNDHLARE